MPLQLANRSVLHICLLSHCLKKAISTPASYVQSVLILLVECLIPYLVLLDIDFLHYASFKQDGSLFAAAGDACAYCWDVESGKCKMTFKGHTDYLHSIAVREANHQVVTGSEDGTARIWDCRSGKCTQTIRPVQNKKFEGSWVGCIAIDASESWLACGTSSGISVWSLLSNECIFNADCGAPVQDLLFDKNQVSADLYIFICFLPAQVRPLVS
ncbi:unnamed protein product [Triticum turgidum subsp. durum]|uniref:Uncharacterized protein n=1 Tax=Triticum turgidum subsp. durum TaxID=4567 RepID=A0A9R0TPD9_TRITD|nr:unnamed protein product [Triticum turgidum subsp. durum]